MEILELLVYINKGLAEGKNVTSLGKELGLSESTIRKRLNKNGYKRIDNKFVLKDDTTDSTMSNNISKEPLKNITKTDTKNDITNSITINNSVDIDKLNLLLNNLDELLKLVQKHDTTCSITIRSDETRVTSLRINQELYNMIKDRSKKENTSISDIVNRALLDYLKNYI